MSDLFLTDADRKKFRECVEEAKKGGVGDSDAHEMGMVVFLKYKCLTDLFFLGYEMLGLRGVKVHKKVLIHPPLHRQLARAIEQPGSKMIIIPRYCLKTEWVIIWIVQRILQEPETVRIAYISRTAGLGRSVLKRVVQYLMNPSLMELFEGTIPKVGKLTQGMPTNWDRITEDFLTVHRDRTDGIAPKEHQLEVFGIEATITGKHFTDQIYDDPINEETVRSPSQMQKSEEFVQHAVNLLEPGGNETYIGTPYHYADLIAHCIQEKYFDRIYRRSMVENGKSIYPTFFPLAEIEKRKKRMGNYIFSCQLMCDPLPKEDLLFPPPQPTYTELPGEKMDYYITVDPAATTQTYSDFTAFAVVAIDGMGRVWVEDSFQIKKEGQEIARILIQLNEKYKPRRIGIEAGLQTHLIGIIQLLKKNWEVAQGAPIALPIEPIVVSTKDKYDRFNISIGSWIRTGRMKIKETLHPLMSQMEKVNRNYVGHDDLVDAVALVFQLVPAFGGGMKRVDGQARVFDTFEQMMKRGKDPVRWGDRFAV
jgi:hypothetical protein